jgi:2-polyprenyl-6-methoxyphenol hydroxylase-like FAD-dependent oxidoreductase
VKILVSGAGIAGLACALELDTRGHDVTVVEYARHLRVTGTPIDIRGDAIEAADKMGLLEKIQKKRVRMSELTQFVDSRGESVARIPMAEISDSEDDIELLREDLVRILADALPDTAVIRFDESIETLTDDAYLRHLGVYFALADYPAEAQSEGAKQIYNVPGRMAGIVRYRGEAVAVFQFRSEPIDYDHRNLNAQKQILIDAFAGYRSWRIPEMLDAARADPGLYFTSASQIHLPSWHRGRVVLVGDAGYCPAFLSGRGTSLALTGAHFLAEELERCGDDHISAFARYETRQRPYVTFAQDRAGSGRDRMLPATWTAIAARNKALQAPKPIVPQRTWENAK